MSLCLNITLMSYVASYGSILQSTWNFPSISNLFTIVSSLWEISCDNDRTTTSVYLIVVSSLIVARILVWKCRRALKWGKADEESGMIKEHFSQLSIISSPGIFSQPPISQVSLFHNAMLSTHNHYPVCFQWMNPLPGWKNFSTRLKNWWGCYQKKSLVHVGGRWKREEC